MNLNLQLHLAAGIGSLALGTGAFLRAPRRLRNRLFGLLCTSLSIWNLGVVAHGTLPGPDLAWHRTFLLGSCASAPIALHFALRLRGGLRRSTRKRLLFAYGAAAAVWLSSWTPAYDDRVRWNLVALVVLGMILLAALVVLVRRIRRLPRGPERRAYSLLLGAGIIAAVGGISDFLPIAPGLQAGPVAVLLLLLVVCGIVVRYRFLDVDLFLAQALAVLAAGVSLAVVIHLVVGAFGDRFLPLLATSILVVLAAAPVVKFLHSGSRSLLGRDDSLRNGLLGTSRRISLARSLPEVRHAFSALDGPDGSTARISLYLKDRPGGAFRDHTDRAARGIEAGDPLCEILQREQEPISARLLELEARERSGPEADRARAALRTFSALGAAMLAPLRRSGNLVGWLVLRGIADGRLDGDLAAALQLVGGQAMESVARIEATEEARRRESLAAVGELAAGLAHEVRNPLAAIRGAAQVLDSAPAEERCREMLQVISDESERLGRVAGEFLEYARPASPRREVVDLAEMARRVSRAAAAAGRAMRTEIVVGEGAPPAWGDPDQLHRVLENLAANAWEAAGAEGRLRIEIRAGSGGRVEMRVDDDGPGVPAKEAEKLFRPFHSTKEGGTGLGLALVHRIIDAHGGEIRFSPGGLSGAGFVITLPAPYIGSGGGEG